MRIRAALGQGGAAPIRSEPDGPCRVSRGGNLCSDPSPVSVPGTLGARTLESQVPSGAPPQTGAEISLNTSLSTGRPSALGRWPQEDCVLSTVRGGIGGG